MDVDRFDALSRSLSTAGSRRCALTALVSGTLGLFGAQAEETAAKNCKKIKNKAKRKKCLAKARCVPSCAGKVCGDDGCGGVCGVACTGNLTCDNGTCLCPPGQGCGTACCPPGQGCVGGICQGAGTCQPGDNVCTGAVGCNGSNACDCLTRFSDSALVCGNIAPAALCIACDEDGDCVSFGAGAFCAKKVGEGCCDNVTLNTGFCAVPC